MKQNRLAWLVAAGVLASMLVNGPAGANDDCHGAEVHSLSIQIEKQRDAYRIGDVIRLTAKVTRATSGDPVADARVNVGLAAERVALLGSTTTDADGIGLLKIRVSRYARPSVVDLNSFVEKKVVDTECGASEVGDHKKPRFLRILAR